ncbi:MAG TPA: ubiquinol-cytochrome c reductase iron-sulfur subunit N-terminal domain-containing protein [Burkholderiaceae bacterium]|nr:ubiquinol-cytochrome c reductase iron-sulfur subunit N-terminal domain-containing protein [Burkholderiaceae bacterium]
MSDKTAPQVSRRRLFAAGGTVGALAAAAAVVPLVRQPEAPVVEAKPAPEKGGGYRLSAHVQQYYDTART